MAFATFGSRSLFFIWLIAARRRKHKDRNNTEELTVLQPAPRLTTVLNFLLLLDLTFATVVQKMLVKTTWTQKEGHIHLQYYSRTISNEPNMFQTLPVQ